MTSTAFLTDFYEISMLQSALEDGMANRKAVFELFARKLPKGRKYGIVGGVQRAIEAVENFTFTPEQINYIKQNPLINKKTIQYLEDFSFSGTIKAYQEGDVFLPYSPVVQVESTFGEAVLLETVLLSILNHDSAIASASARMVQATREARDKIKLIEMGSRRTHEASAVHSARMAYITGFDATSNIEAGFVYGIPVTGTSAHAFSLAHKDEKEAFTQQVKALGPSTTLLVDTYDIEQGIKNALEVAGSELGGIRIDSGSLYEETMKARRQLDEAGAVRTKIVLSSDIDEFLIDELIEQGTPFDVIGAGTRVVTGSGHPTAGMVYKLVSIEDDNGKMRSVAKKASGKKSMGGKKEAWRKIDTNGKVEYELVFEQGKETLDTNSNYIPLHQTYIDKGKVVDLKTIDEIREFHADVMETLTKTHKSIQAGDPIPTFFERNETK